MYGYLDEIINEIELQRYCMRARYNIEPNKVILGKKICSALEAEARNWRCPEDRVIKTVVGLPITIDYENIYTIEVCFELDGNVKNFESFSR